MSVLGGCTLTLLVLHWSWRRSGWQLVDYLGIGFWYAYARIWHRWSSNGPAPLPQTGPAILVSNHTCSSDPSFLTAGSARRLSFLVAHEFYSPLTRWLLDFICCVPVRRNQKDVRAVRIALRRLNEGNVVCIFPEGGLSNAGRYGPLVGKSGVAYLALKSRAPVYPVRIVGGPQTSSVPRAWLWPSSGVRVTFAPALDLSAYYDRPIDRQILEEVTGLIMKRIAEIEVNTKRLSCKGGSHERS